MEREGAVHIQVVTDSALSVKRKNTTSEVLYEKY